MLQANVILAPRSRRLAPRGRGDGVHHSLTIQTEEAASSGPPEARYGQMKRVVVEPCAHTRLVVRMLFTLVRLVMPVDCSARHYLVRTSMHFGSR
jgi:hypothetical protein